MTEIVSVLHGLADNTQNSYFDALVLTGYQSPTGNIRGPYSQVDPLPSGLGLGAGCGNFYSAGVFDGDEVGTNTSRLLKRGTIYGATQVASGTPADLDPALVKEYVDGSSRYNQADLCPSAGVTVPDAGAGYTWHKAPRYPNTGTADCVKEVGPLARMWVEGDYRYGNTAVTMTNHAYSTANGGPLPALGTLGVQYNQGLSLLDRHRARAQEAKKIAIAYDTWLTSLNSNLTGSRFTRRSMPTGTVYGLGLTEAPRGSVLHWAKIVNGKVDNYQIIAPTTWNCSSRDTAGNPGPVEHALIGTNVPLGLVPLRGVKSPNTASGLNIPVEALLVIHSFDPCIACSVHMVDPKNDIKRLVYQEGGVTR